jgi:hypothetical protein
MASLKSFLSNHGVKQFALYTAAVLVPVAIGFVNSWSAAGAAGPIIALLLREVDHVFLQPAVATGDVPVEAPVSPSAASADTPVV